MTIYLILNADDYNVILFNSLKHLAIELNIDARTAKKYLNSNKKVHKKYLIQSNEVHKYQIKRKKGKNVSRNGSKVHFSDDF